MARRRYGVVAAVLVALAGTGCAGNTLSGGGPALTKVSPPPAVAVPVDDLNCDIWVPDAGRPRARDWVAVAVCPAPVAPLRASPGTPDRPRLVHGDLTALVAALAQPDAPPPASGVCAAYAVLVPRLWLVDGDGMAYQAHVPTDGCAHPTEAAMAALRSLGLI